MSAPEPAPEQVIRRWLEEHGDVRVGMEAIEQTWQLDRLDAADRRRIALALESAGVRVEPPLQRVSRGERLTLSLERAAPEPEPEPEPSPEPEPEPSPEPERPAPEPEPEPEPEWPAPEAETEPPPAEREPSGGPASVRATARTAALGASAAIALMVTGSLAPWAKNVFVTDNGLDRDGALVIGAAVVAAIVLLRYARAARLGRPSRLPIISAGLGAAAAGVAAADFRELVDDVLVEPAWGLYMAFAGSALLVMVSMALLARR